MKIVLGILLLLISVVFTEAQTGVEGSSVSKDAPDTIGSRSPVIPAIPPNLDKPVKTKMDEANRGFVILISKPPDETKMNWGGAMRESLLFLGIMHGFRVAAEPDTRYQFTHGKFMKEWFKAVGQLRGWRDGDNAMTNYVGHPFQGAISGRIFLQNSPKASPLEFSNTSEYKKSRFKAFIFATLFSLQFELGPLSEAAIGNNPPSSNLPHPTSYVDLVITPVLGTTWLVSEDVLDKYLVSKLEDKYSNRRWVAWITRTFLNPSRSFSNILRFKRPWYRESRN